MTPPASHQPPPRRATLVDMARAATPWAPTTTDRETGWPGNLRPSNTFRGTPIWVPDPADDNPDLQFPESVRVYGRMRDTDSQVGSVLRACTLPIERAPWHLEGDVSDEVDDLVRTNLGIPKPGEQLPRRARGAAGIVWSEHLHDALLALTYGFMPFQQVTTVTWPGQPGHPAWATTRPVVHLKKLASRLPTTLTHDGVRIALDGGLQAIVQQAPTGVASGYGAPGDKDIVIPVDELVMYTVGKEGGNWYGRSVLRAAYKDWYLKDRAERINLQALDRNGMGIPIVTYDPNSSVTREDALRLAAEIRAGAEAGAAVPVGMDVRLRGVEGNTVDALPTIKHYDEAISRSVLAMFLDLGHDTGARSLGDTFLTVFVASLQAVADEIAATATDHIIRDLVEWNFGPDEPYPTLTAGQISSDQALTPEGIKMLADAKLITPDPDLEAHLRDRFRLPAAPKVTAQGSDDSWQNPILGTNPDPDAETDPTVDDAQHRAALAGYERRLLARLATMKA